MGFGDHLYFRHIDENIEEFIELIQEEPKQVIVNPIDESFKYFADNPNLGPPYHLLLDTNFIHFSISSFPCYGNRVVRF